MGKHVLVVGVPWSSSELAVAAVAAEACDARLTVADVPRVLNSVDAGARCERLPVRAMRADDIVAALDGRAFDAVVSITELTMELAAEVRTRLGLRGTSAATERAVFDKWVTRDTLVRAGLSRTGYWDVPMADLPAFVRETALPVIVKPRAFTGSTGVTLLNEPDQVDSALAPYDLPTLERLGRTSVLVEEYIPGQEVSAEGIVVDGTLTLLTLTDKVNTGAPTFYEVGHVMPSRHNDAMLDRVQQYLQKVSDALGIETSALHAELKILGDRVELVEIHSRLGGGNIVALLKQAYGIDAYRAYFAAVLNGQHPRRGRAEQVCGIGFFVGRTHSPMRWPSFDFPHPAAIVAVDYDARRQPKVVTYEGLRIEYWRAGHAVFASSDYTEVLENVTFVRNCVIEPTFVTS